MFFGFSLFWNVDKKMMETIQICSCEALASNSEFEIYGLVFVKIAIET